MTAKTVNGDDVSAHTRDPSAVAKRVNRALDGFYHVETTSNPGEYTVFSESGSTYTVNVSDGSCTCPDGQRANWCKHAHRVAFVTGEIPDIDGIHVELAETDADESEPDDASDEDDTETFAERIERFEANNPGASAMETISQLGISPDKMDRVEEILE
ncbi:MAG TPA: SWIM zinc finger family protein [Halococcus sp.]|nr:SWIM zinc finger family protein [Halococcus sp.]